MQSSTPHHRSRILPLIGALKLLKAALLFAVGTGVLKLLHRDVEQQVSQWITEMGVAPGSHYLQAAIEKLDMLDDRKLKQLGIGLFVYGLFFFVEGVGLCLRKRWAEYFTIGMTMSLVPIEIYEIWRRPTAVRFIVLVVNLAIVAYLAFNLRRDADADSAAASTSG